MFGKKKSVKSKSVKVIDNNSFGSDTPKVVNPRTSGKLNRFETVHYEMLGADKEFVDRCFANKEYVNQFLNELKKKGL